MWFQDDGTTVPSPTKVGPTYSHTHHSGGFGGPTLGQQGSAISGTGMGAPQGFSHRRPVRYSSPTQYGTTRFGVSFTPQDHRADQREDPSTAGAGGQLGTATSPSGYIDVDTGSPEERDMRSQVPLPTRHPNLQEARLRRKQQQHGGGGSERASGSRGNSPSPDVYEQFSRHVTGASSLDELLAAAPTLSAGFHCSEEDATILLALVTASGNHQGTSADVGRLEDRNITLESEGKMLRQRLERRTDEVEKLKDDLEGARGKVSAVEQQARQTVSLVSQKRDELRRQLINEEGRTMKLQKQVKNLETEVDRLKGRLHSLMK